MSYIRNVNITPSVSSSDAFGRIRFSSPQTIFDSKQIYDNQPFFWDDAGTGAGSSSTYNSNQASTTIAVSSLTAGARIRQTFRRFNYQPGKSSLILMSGVFKTTGAGITKQIGHFDAENGLFFRLTSAGISVVRRTKTSGSVVDNVVARSSWNIDKLDGTGASGVTLDFSKTQILVIDFEWLGVGSVRFGFVVNGSILYCHQINNANNLSLVYMSTPNLPLRYEIINDGTGAADGLDHICSTVIVEGGRDENGFELCIDRGATGLTTLNDSDIYPLIAARLKSTRLGATIQFSDLSLLCTSTAAFRWVLVLNPTITGTALSYTGVTNSALEVDFSTTNATKVTAGTGVLLASGYGQASNESGINLDLPSNLTIGSKIDGTADIMVLGVQRITGTTETFFGSLSWNEQV